MIAEDVAAEGEGRPTTTQVQLSTRLYRVGWQLCHHAMKHRGVGIVCSVAYFDPGNWSVDLQAGSQYGYSLLFVVLLSGIIATFLQVLAARLGTVTGLGLASHCRLLFHDRPRHKLLWRWGVLYPLYVLAEIAIICTDLGEMLGSAIALTLLFPILPMWSTVLLTATDVMLLLAIENPLKSRPVKLFEGIIAVLVLAVLICMAIITSRVGVNWGDAFRGFVPSKELFASAALYTSVGIVGSTVMPHSIFLGSHLATQDRLTNDSEQEFPRFPESSPHPMSLFQRILRSVRYTFNCRRLFSISHSDENEYPTNVLTHGDRENNDLCFVRLHIYHGMADVATSLMSFAVIINSLILIISSAVFYYNSGAYGTESPASLFDAHSFIRDSIGNGTYDSITECYLFDRNLGPALLFALALLAAGQSSSIVATVAGQSVSEGFLRWKVSPTLRRLITRIIGLVPSVTIASVVGKDGINALLVMTQVVLSIVLPFIILPLVYLTSSSRIMTARPRSSASPTGSLSGSTFLHAIDRVDGSDDKEANSQDADEAVDFSNGKIVTSVGYIIWLIIIAANLYALATL